MLAVLTGGAFAQATHPENGETLAENQTFTYRILEPSSP